MVRKNIETREFADDNNKTNGISMPSENKCIRKQI